MFLGFFVELQNQSELHCSNNQQRVNKYQTQGMADTQEYELKLAVSHHPSLKTQQLIEFLENESNEFLSNDLPNSLTQDRFVTTFEPLSKQAKDDEFSEYVGIVLLYSSGSQDSYEFMKKNIPDRQYLADMFLIIVEMDNSDKQANAIGDEGEKMCQKMGFQFVRLTLYNSEDLVSALHRNLYELIENYYYPNEEQRPAKKNYDSQYMFHYADPNEAQQGSPTGLVRRTNGRIIATKEQKKSIQKLLDKASEMRESRQQQVFLEQREIDESIQNVEKVLNNINRNIKDKVSANWYTSLNHTLYSPLEKNSVSFAKIKLTQEFLDDDNQQKTSARPGESRMKVATPGKSALVNKFIAKHKKLEPLMKLVLAVAESVIVELQVFENSSYEELAGIAIRKFGISDTAHNSALMQRIISERIQDFIKELTRAVKATEKQRIDQRSFLKNPTAISNNSQFQSLRTQF